MAYAIGAKIEKPAHSLALAVFPDEPVLLECRQIVMVRRVVYGDERFVRGGQALEPNVPDHPPVSGIVQVMGNDEVRGHTHEIIGARGGIAARAMNYFFSSCVWHIRNTVGNLTMASTEPPAVASIGKQRATNV